MNNLELYEAILNEIETDIKNRLQVLANTNTPQELILKPELLDLINKYKIEKEIMQ